MSGKGMVKLIYSLLVLFFLFSCSEKIEEEAREHISRVKFSSFQEQLSNAQSLEESQRLDSMIFSKIEEASIGRYLPQLFGMDENRNQLIIDTSFNKPCLLVLYSPFCGWNSVDLANELPMVVEPKSQEFEVVVLLFLESRPELNIPSDFYKVQIEQLRYLYPKSYLINGKEASKLNMYALPSRYYFNEQGKLIQLKKGKVSTNRMKNELEEFRSKLADQ